LFISAHVSNLIGGKMGTSPERFQNRRKRKYPAVNVSIWFDRIGRKKNV